MLSAVDRAAQIDAARLRPDAGAVLVDLLAEQSPLYAGLGSSEAERLRGYVLASFDGIGLPPEAIPFILEALETDLNPYVVAAAGRALRNAAAIPPEALELIVAAIARLRSNDDVVSFAEFSPIPDPANAVSALADLLLTLTQLGPRATGALPALKLLVRRDGAGYSTVVRAAMANALRAMSEPDASPTGCCNADPDDHGDDHGDVSSWRPPCASMIRAALGELELENQDGDRLTFSNAFGGKPTALAFFYTRCMNPLRCSLTVTKLARIALKLADERIDANVAAISYDPRFDRPGRLKAYGADRGMRFSPSSSLLRTVGPFDPLRDTFDLGVGFGPVTVNQHRVDLLVLDHSLAVTDRFERRIWDDKAVLAALCRSSRCAVTAV